MSGNSININNLCYNVEVLKKKSSVKNALLGPYLGKNKASMSLAQNQVQSSKKHKLSRTFLSIYIIEI